MSLRLRPLTGRDLEAVMSDIKATVSSDGGQACDGTLATRGNLRRIGRAVYRVSVDALSDGTFTARWYLEGDGIDGMSFETRGVMMNAKTERAAIANALGTFVPVGECTSDY